MNNEFFDTYARKLSRFSTFLYRHKTKYMNEKLKEYDLQGLMFMMVNYVHHHPGTSQDAVACHMNIDKCTIARRTNRLEELGYLVRKTDENDRRQNNLFLTEAGEKLVPIIKDNLAKWNALVTDELTDDEKVMLITLLGKVINTCENNPVK
ncbi:MAG: MarR family transcriptional regulator [Ruminococcaceae bacterium]|nr:MarR family transcriptional regulator [Oscillospiraceae bacterium]